MITDIGKKIKELRNNKGFTLKELSEKTGFSIGFLSQLERGMTSIDIDSLEKISEALGVDVIYFFSMSKRNKRSIMRSYEREIFHIEESKFIHYHLSNNIEESDMLPRLIEILPSNNEEDIVPYRHEGEEFVFVLEGVLTIYIDNERNELYPGDSLHISSTTAHNWTNYTNKVVKILAVNTPNHFNKIINLVEN